MKDLYHYTECGLPSVYLRNGFDRFDTGPNERVAINDQKGLHRTIGLHITTRKPNVTGAEVRFLRKEMDMSQKHLGRILGVGENSIRGWENHRTKISGPAERLLRILYIEYVEGSSACDGKIRRLIEQLSEANREKYRRDLMLHDTDDGWKEAA